MALPTLTKPGDNVLQRQTDVKKQQFLKVIRETGNVRAASEAIGEWRSKHYDWLAADPDYKRAYEQAQRDYLEKLERNLDQRAFEGIERELTYQGRKTGETITERSDILAMFRLKRLDPAYRDNVPAGQGASITFNVTLPPGATGELVDASSAPALPAPAPTPPEGEPPPPAP